MANYSKLQLRSSPRLEYQHNGKLSINISERQLTEIIALIFYFSIIHLFNFCYYRTKVWKIFNTLFHGISSWMVYFIFIMPNK